jgi:hypothetical protein
VGCSHNLRDAITVEVGNGGTASDVIPRIGPRNPHGPAGKLVPRLGDGVKRAVDAGQDKVLLAVSIQVPDGDGTADGRL